MNKPKCKACGRSQVKDGKCGYCRTAMPSVKPPQVFKFRFVLDMKGGRI